MRSRILISALILLALAGTGQAGPVIVLFNNPIPVPSIQLVSITPQDHQQLDKSPRSVDLIFSQTIIAEKSALKVFDPYNNPITSNMTMPKDTRMSVLLPPNLLTGTYRVEWKATCGCNGSPTASGTSYFTVQ